MVESGQPCLFVFISVQPNASLVPEHTNLLPFHLCRLMWGIDSGHSRTREVSLGTILLHQGKRGMSQQGKCINLWHKELKNLCKTSQQQIITNNTTQTCWKTMQKPLILHQGYGHERICASRSLEPVSRLVTYNKTIFVRFHKSGQSEYKWNPSLRIPNVYKHKDCKRENVNV